jgi:hypothetical protein
MKVRATLEPDRSEPLFFGSRVALAAAGRRGCGGWILAALTCLLFCGGAFTARAALQFDIFLGYDGVVPEGSWFPIVCEIKNDGPSFNGVVEVSPGSYNQGQTREVRVELPTGTLKRLVIPVFSTTRGYSTWDVVLLDDHGRTRAEQLGQRPRKQVAHDVPILGALSRTAGGAPVIRQVLAQQSEAQPIAARLLPQIFPDNPLVLEGMACLYLNSEKAPELNAGQANALARWVHAGGHLVVGIEQVSEVEGTPWLKDLFPCELKEIRTVKSHPELQAWLRNGAWPTNFHYSTHYRPGRSGRAKPAPESSLVESNPFSDLADDFTFEMAEMQVAAGEVIEGRVEVAAGDTPLIVTANRGRGRVTALLFSPEREPFRSWKNLPTFWARVAEVPGAWYVSADYNPQSGWSTDGVFGAMIDTRQVHKLPVTWLLLLLIVYLVVIGPLDQFWVKRIGKPMLTWITFPCYVVIFSLVIYFIGYRLRAGESEWNELHVVDVLRNGDHAELRGCTYASVYSPSNQRYQLAAREKYATLRGEFVGGWNGGQSSEKATVMQDGDSFNAEIFVPVWTSQLFINDWWQPAAMPLEVSVARKGEGWQVAVENRTDHKVTKAQIVLGEYIIPLGDVPPGESKSFQVSTGQGTPLTDYVSTHSSGFQQAVMSRQRAFGATERGHIDDLPTATIAASFLSQMQRQDSMQNFISSPGLDMARVARHGNAVLFALASDYSPVPAMNRFSPRRIHRDTMWRVAVEIKE